MSPFVQLDDQIANHPKILKAGPEAAWLWACAIAYCQNHLTDGFVPREALLALGAFKRPRALAERLVGAWKYPGGHGLFERRGEDYAVHDYLEHNPSAEAMRARQARLRERSRVSIFATQVFIAFEGRCAYCTTDAGPFEIDHKTPISRGGLSTLENLALACRACNQRKRARTAEEFIAAGCQ